jgi:putative ABC transport system permease protein
MLTTYRTLFKRPAFFLAVVMTVTLGIGANSSIFSVIDAVLLKPLPYPSSDRLMALYESNPRRKTEHGQVAPVRVEEWNRLAKSFSGIAGAYTESLAETSGSLPERLVVARVSPRFFSVLATPPLAGRAFSPEEGLFNGPNAAVISERLWRRRFNASPSAIGATLRLGSYSYPIVGVVPDSFRFPAPDADVWTPSGLPPGVMTNRQARFYTAVGRVREGMALKTAQAELAGVQGQLAIQNPKTDTNWTALAEPLKEETVGGARRSLWILYGAVSLVLLIACANVACLLLAQAQQRRRDIAIRFSLGARRWQVVKELLRESFCLALPGALLGLALAEAGASLLRKSAAVLPRVDEIQVDWRIVAFTLTLCLLTTVLAGLFPALRATKTITARGQIGGSGRSLAALVSAQIALAVVLLIGSGLLIRTLSNMGRTPMGFEPHNLLAFRISASWGEINDASRVERRMVRTLETLRAIPGVESAAIALGLPKEEKDSPIEFTIPGRDAQGEKLFADAQLVTSDYFHTMRVPVLSGETCNANYDAKAPSVALVNRAFADRFFPGESPLGRSIATDVPSRIIGVVGDVRQHGASHDPVPTIYYCGIPRFYPDPEYIVRSAADPMLIADAIRRQVRSIEPNRAVYELTRVTDALADSDSARRFQTLLLGLFAGTALLLAVVGLYGVMTFFVSQRTREIGLRMALGAQPSQILTRVLRIAAITSASGMALGLLGATLLTRQLQDQLYGVSTLDPATFSGVAALLALVAAAAALLPARRAMAVDPIEALRQE